MSIKILYKREAISSTLLTLSAAAFSLLLLASSVLPLSNVLLQPVQAQTAMNFRTPTPAGGDDSCVGSSSTITFDVQGTASSGDLNISSGTFNVIDSDVPASYSGKITGGKFNNDSNGRLTLALQGTVEKVSSPTLSCSMIQGSTYEIDTPCSTSNAVVTILPSYSDKTNYFNSVGVFHGVVECSSSQGNTASSSMTGTGQDSDGDGIADSSDRCDHNSNQRCYKESK